MSAQPAEFTPAERDEIITRLASMENRLAAIGAQVEYVAQFAANMTRVLDAIGSNPMLAAMMPPDAQQAISEVNGG